jgi:hypothetical protein
MKTIYKISTASGEFVALTIEKLNEIDAAQVSVGCEKLERLDQLSSNRFDTDGDYSLEYEVDDCLFEKLLASDPETWGQVEDVADSNEYEENFESNKFGSWSYKFELVVD